MGWRWLPLAFEVNKERHERHLVIIISTHPDGRPRELRLVGDDDVIDLLGDEQFGTIYLRTEKPGEGDGKA
jgi:hypothetical protein